MIRHRLAAALSLPLLLLPATGCGLLDQAVNGTYTMPSESMQPTIRMNAELDTRRVDGDYVPRRDDIVVFRPPADWEGNSPDRWQVSRVVGAPGDRVACCDNPGALLEVNDVPRKETFLAPGPVSARGFDVKVPQGRLWVMSDNRSVALDSRAHMDASGGGTIAVTDVIAVVEDWARP
ncbi:signal peptidase I [Nonomuraea sp. NPDC050783]|uniref:signal peptidase I n=1 Tax=Nonomuraea sp. NPDC050783 TaxID=3154634 RepID=UPI003465CF53